MYSSEYPTTAVTGNGDAAATARPISTNGSPGNSTSEASLVLLPGEPFVEIGLAVAAASPFPVTAVVGYSEEYIGYIPTDRAFGNRGYETGPGRWSRCAAGAETAMRDAAIELLRDLR